MSDYLKKDFYIKRPDKSEAIFNKTNGIVTRYFTLMSALGQNTYNVSGDDAPFELGQSLEDDPRYTRKHFQRQPLKFLTNGEGTIFQKSSEEIGLEGEQAEYHKILHDLLKDGVGMQIPPETQVILDPNQPYPKLFFKEKTDTNYSLGGQMPGLQDEDNIFVIEEQSLEMIVHQRFKPDDNDDYYVTQGVQTGAVHQVIDDTTNSKPPYPEFIKSVLGELGFVVLKEGQTGNQITAVLGHSKSSEKTKRNYYESQTAKGRLIIIMPYPIAQVDILGVVAMHGDSASEIVLTTTT